MSAANVTRISLTIGVQAHMHMRMMTPISRNVGKAWEHPVNVYRATPQIILPQLVNIQRKVSIVKPVMGSHSKTTPLKSFPS